MDDQLEEVVRDLDQGNFSKLQVALGGPEGFDRQIIALHAAGKFDETPELLAEALSCSCMLGRTETAAYLIDQGVDPYAGMKTGLAGPHYAVSGGHLDVVKMLLKKKIPLEIRNLYGGTLLGQALYSAINEHAIGHAEIMEILIEAGAEIESGTLEWWSGQPVPSRETKRRVIEAFRTAEGK